jgi:hypothetical protein
MKHSQRGFLGLVGVQIYVMLALAAALALSWAAIWYLDGKVDAANENTRKAEGERAKEEQSRLGFQATAASCSAGTAELAKRAADAEKAFKDKKAESDKYSHAVAAYITDLLTSQRPAGLDECAATRAHQDAEVDRRAVRRSP